MRIEILLCVKKKNQHEKQGSSTTNFDLWLLVINVNHLLMRSWQKEMDQYQIPPHQTYILRTIQTLGARATLSESAKKIERDFKVISRQDVKMENDGLIKRIKDK